MFNFIVFEDPTVTISGTALGVVALAASVTLVGRTFSSTNLDNMLRAQAVLIRMNAKLSNIWTT